MNLLTGASLLALAKSIYYVVYTSYVTKNLMNFYHVKIKIWDLRIWVIYNVFIK